jgi:low temperature requirement protein LtrA
LAAAVALFAIEGAGPIVAERMGALKGDGSTPWHPHHLAERFALLTIIALGETVLGTLASSAEVSAVQGWTVNAVIVVGTGIALAFALWWVYFLVPHAAVLAVRRDKALIWGYAHIVVYASIAAVGAGLHLIGCTYAPRCSIGATATVAAIGAPVVVFMFVRYLLQSWLASALPRHSLRQITATALPLVAVGLARVGVPAWACLLVVVSSPVTIILAFEFGAWRSLDAQLARVLKAK